MNDTSYLLLIFLSPLLQNVVLAWVFKALTNGDSKTFWVAFFVLIGIRLFFYVVDAIFRVLSFSLYRKKFVVRKIVDDFRRLEFPMREDPNEDWLTYLTRLQETESLPFAVRRAAAIMEGQMDLHDKSGFVIGRRSESAMEAALAAWTRAPEKRTV